MRLKRVVVELDLQPKVKQTQRVADLQGWVHQHLEVAQALETATTIWYYFGTVRKKVVMVDDQCLWRRVKLHR